MSTNRVYLDHAATSPLRPQALAAMSEAWALPGNPSSVHAEGRAAKAALERARKAVAGFCGVKPSSVVFTSGGTEANALALHQAFARGLPVLAGATEHASVLDAGAVETIPVNAAGALDLGRLSERLSRGGVGLAARESIGLVAAMLVNNETGMLQPNLAEAAGLAREAGALFHVDAVQALGRCPVAPGALSADTVAIAAHKVGGPRGVGALLLRDGLELTPLIRGSQESRRRGGTEATGAATGFAAALGAWSEGEADRQERLGQTLRRLLKEQAPDALIVGEGLPGAARITSVALPGVPAMTQLMRLDLAGFAVSAGAACSSGKVGESHVLAAMGLPAEVASCTIRVSFGWSSTARDVERFAEAYAGMVRAG